MEPGKTQRRKKFYLGQLTQVWVGGSKSLGQLSQIKSFYLEASLNHRNIIPQTTSLLERLLLSEKKTEWICVIVVVVFVVVVGGGGGVINSTVQLHCRVALVLVANKERCVTLSGRQTEIEPMSWYQSCDKENLSENPNTFFTGCQWWWLFWAWTLGCPRIGSFQKIVTLLTLHVLW